jgi:hypothetical protein
LTALDDQYGSYGSREHAKANVANLPGGAEFTAAPATRWIPACVQANAVTTGKDEFACVDARPTVITFLDCT